MTKKHIWIVRVAALWTFYVWAVLVRNMIIDHTNSLAFRAVHIGLAIISFAFAAGTWRVSNVMSKELKVRKKAKASGSDQVLINPQK